MLVLKGLVPFHQYNLRGMTESYGMVNNLSSNNVLVTGALN